jgi:membrane-associated phospholipid phosphatase
MRARIKNFDHASMLAIARRRHPILTTFLRLITITGEGRWWAAVVTVLGLSTFFDWFRFENREFILFATLSPGIAWIFVKALKVVWRRRRPFQVLEGYSPLTYSPRDDSFPSGHTASVVAFLVAMSPLGPGVTLVLSVWAALVSFSRFYLGVHFPSDILVGALIGLVSGSGMIEIRTAYGLHPSMIDGLNIATR